MNGFIHSGGAGTEIDISADGTTVGNFTPGAPLVGANGTTVKFSGVETDHHGFGRDSTALSGAFTSTTIVPGITISLNEGTPVAVKPAATSDSYKCVGNGLTLTFHGDPTELVYTMVHAK